MLNSQRSAFDEVLATEFQNKNSNLKLESNFKCWGKLRQFYEMLCTQIDLYILLQLFKHHTSAAEAQKNKKKLLKNKIK
jgi:hypothetical protein